jgi:biofilm PGA synthesis lipoprotein PgaB
MRLMRRSREQAQFGQMLIGLLAIPLSVLPFLAYGTFTPEGRLVRDRVRVALSPPHLPKLTEAQQRTAAQAAPRYAGKVMALAYHGIGSGSDGESGGDDRFAISPARFGEHLATLRAAGMHTVTAADVASAFRGGKPLPDNAVMITFDDGRSDAMLWADPLLKEAGMKATMFVISSAAAEPGIYYAGWDRLRTAARSGRWDIEAHTHASHREQDVTGGEDLPALTSLAPGESLDAYRRRVADDLEENSAAILAHVGRRPVAFAYPFGAYGADRTNDPGIRAVLREEVARRFVLAFHQDEQDTIPLVDTSQEGVVLRRLEVENVSGMALLHLINRSAQAAQFPNGESDNPPVVVVQRP